MGWSLITLAIIVFYLLLAVGAFYTVLGLYDEGKLSLGYGKRRRHPTAFAASGGSIPSNTDEQDYD